MRTEMLQICGMRVFAELLLARLDANLLASMQGNPYWSDFWHSYEAKVAEGGVCHRWVPPKEGDDNWVAFEASLGKLAAAIGCDGVRALMQAEDSKALAKSLLPLPFVCEDGTYLYTQRQFLCEIRLARALRTLSLNDDAFRIRADVPFEMALSDLSDEQRHAIELILSHRLTVVSGKPGSGKTTVVVRALSILFSQCPGLVVFQMAPTGKASSRIEEALAAAIANTKERHAGIVAMRDAKDAGRIRTRTVDKWLLDLEHAPRLQGSPKVLDADIVVVDEASMLSIQLAMRLFEAIDPRRTRVIVLGDKNQLAAVGPGRVFADLCETDQSVLQGHVALFKMSHRFPDASRVGQMADLLLQPVSEERDARLLAILEDLRLKSAKPKGATRVESRKTREVSESIRAWLEEHFDPVFEALSECLSASCHDAVSERTRVVKLCDRIRNIRVLCASRAGVNGLEAINAYMEDWMRIGLGLPLSPNSNFPGRLVIVRENRPALGLSNGDVGVVLDVGDGGLRRKVFVPETFGMRSEDRLTDCIDVRELPRCEAAYALTVHQSQGSEYAYVLLILPESRESALATKELLYTGATRVKFSSEELAQECDHLKIVCARDVWRVVTTACVERSGRLYERLSMPMESVKGDGDVARQGGIRIGKTFILDAVCCAESPRKRIGIPIRSRPVRR